MTEATSEATVLSISTACCPGAQRHAVGTGSGYQLNRLGPAEEPVGHRRSGALNVHPAQLQGGTDFPSQNKKTRSFPWH